MAREEQNLKWRMVRWLPCHQVEAPCRQRTLVTTWMSVHLCISNSTTPKVKTGPLPALAGWLGWLEHRPTHQKVTGSISGQGTYLGCGFDPWLGHIQKGTNRCLFLSLPPSLKSINISSCESLKTK